MPGKKDHHDNLSDKEALRLAAMSDPGFKPGTVASLEWQVRVSEERLDRDGKTARLKEARLAIESSMPAAVTKPSRMPRKKVRRVFVAG
jgi:hypothetical protein